MREVAHASSSLGSGAVHPAARTGRSVRRHSSGHISQTAEPRGGPASPPAPCKAFGPGANGPFLLAVDIAKKDDPQLQSQLDK
ncbi:hypothetical protein AB0L40_24430, partial [Patulibacter sp. NPDC049589]|uniref:hypothetical protein n=1 Tax=Patulibacter sp. NPDC049589 TaxID=3154731 RepID=UPI0034299FEF